MIEVQTFPLPASAVHVSDPLPAERVFSAAILGLPTIVVEQPQGRHARNAGGEPRYFELPVTLTFQGNWRVRAQTGIIALLANVEALRTLRALRIAATARITLRSGRIDVDILAPIAPWIVPVNNPEGPVATGSRYLPVHSAYDMNNYGLSHMYVVVTGNSVFIDGNKLGTIDVAAPISPPLTVRAYCSAGRMVIALPHGKAQFVQLPSLAQPLDIYPAAAVVQPLPDGHRTVTAPTDIAADDAGNSSHNQSS